MIDTPNTAGSEYTMDQLLEAAARIRQRVTEGNKIQDFDTRMKYFARTEWPKSVASSTYRDLTGFDEEKSKQAQPFRASDYMGMSDLFSNRIKASDPTKPDLVIPEIKDGYLQTNDSWWDATVRQAALWGGGAYSGAVSSVGNFLNKFDNIIELSRKQTGSENSYINPDTYRIANQQIDPNSEEWKAKMAGDVQPYPGFAPEAGDLTPSAKLMRNTDLYRVSQMFLNHAGKIDEELSMMQRGTVDAISTKIAQGIGSAPVGVAEFAYGNVPWALVNGYAGELEKGHSQERAAVTGLLEGGFRFGLGRVFQASHMLPSTYGAKTGTAMQYGLNSAVGSGEYVARSLIEGQELNTADFVSSLLTLPMLQFATQGTKPFKKGVSTAVVHAEQLQSDAALQRAQWKDNIAITSGEKGQFATSFSDAWRPLWDTAKAWKQEKLDAGETVTAQEALEAARGIQRATLEKLEPVIADKAVEIAEKGGKITGYNAWGRGEKSITWTDASGQQQKTMLTAADYYGTGMVVNPKGRIMDVIRSVYKPTKGFVGRDYTFDPVMAKYQELDYMTDAVPHSAMLGKSSTDFNPQPNRVMIVTVSDGNAWKKPVVAEYIGRNKIGSHEVVLRGKDGESYRYSFTDDQIRFLRTFPQGTIHNKMRPFTLKEVEDNPGTLFISSSADGSFRIVDPKTGNQSANHLGIKPDLEAGVEKGEKWIKNPQWRSWKIRQNINNFVDSVKYLYAGSTVDSDFEVSSERLANIASGKEKAYVALRGSPTGHVVRFTDGKDEVFVKVNKSVRRVEELLSKDNPETVKYLQSVGWNVQRIYNSMMKTNSSLRAKDKGPKDEPYVTVRDGKEVKEYKKGLNRFELFEFEKITPAEAKGFEKLVINDMIGIGKSDFAAKYPEEYTYLLERLNDLQFYADKVANAREQHPRELVDKNGIVHRDLKIWGYLGNGKVLYTDNDYYMVAPGLYGGGKLMDAHGNFYRMSSIGAIGNTNKWGGYLSSLKYKKSDTISGRDMSDIEMIREGQKDIMILSDAQLAGQKLEPGLIVEIKDQVENAASAITRTKKGLFVQNVDRVYVEVESVERMSGAKIYEGSKELARGMGIKEIKFLKTFFPTGEHADKVRTAVKTGRDYNIVKFRLKMPALDWMDYMETLKSRDIKNSFLRNWDRLPEDVKKTIEEWNTANPNQKFDFDKSLAFVHTRTTGNPSNPVERTIWVNNEKMSSLWTELRSKKSSEEQLKFYKEQVNYVKHLDYATVRAAFSRINNYSDFLMSFMEHELAHTTVTRQQFIDLVDTTGMFGKSAAKMSETEITRKYETFIDNVAMNRMMNSTITRAVNQSVGFRSPVHPFKQSPNKVLSDVVAMEGKVKSFKMTFDEWALTQMLNVDSKYFLSASRYFMDKAFEKNIRFGFYELPDTDKPLMEMSPEWQNLFADRAKLQMVKEVEEIMNGNTVEKRMIEMRKEYNKQVEEALDRGDLTPYEGYKIGAFEKSSGIASKYKESVVELFLGDDFRWHLDADKAAMQKSPEGAFFQKITVPKAVLVGKDLKSMQALSEAKLEDSYMLGDDITAFAKRVPVGRPMTPEDMVAQVNEIWGATPPDPAAVKYAEWIDKVTSTVAEYGKYIKEGKDYDSAAAQQALRDFITEGNEIGISGDDIIKLMENAATGKFDSPGRMSLYEYALKVPGMEASMFRETRKGTAPVPEWVTNQWGLDTGRGSMGSEHPPIIDIPMTKTEMNLIEKVSKDYHMRSYPLDRGDYYETLIAGEYFNTIRAQHKAHVEAEMKAAYEKGDTDYLMSDIARIQFRDYPDLFYRFGDALMDNIVDTANKVQKLSGKIATFTDVPAGELGKLYREYANSMMGKGTEERLNKMAKEGVVQTEAEMKAADLGQRKQTREELDESLLPGESLIDVEGAKAIRDIEGKFGEITETIENTIMSGADWKQWGDRAGRLFQRARDAVKPTVTGQSPAQPNRVGMGYKEYTDQLKISFSKIFERSMMLGEDPRTTVKNVLIRMNVPETLAIKVADEYLHHQYLADISAMSRIKLEQRLMEKKLKLEPLSKKEAAKDFGRDTGKFTIEKLIGTREWVGNAWNKLNFYPNVPEAFRLGIREDLFGQINHLPVEWETTYKLMFGNMSRMERDIACGIIEAKDNLSRVKRGRGPEDMFEPEAWAILRERIAKMRELPEARQKHIRHSILSWNTLQQTITTELVAMGRLLPGQTHEDYAPAYVSPYVADRKYNRAWSVPTALTTPFRSYAKQAYGWKSKDGRRERILTPEMLIDHYTMVKMDNIVEHFLTKWCEMYDVNRQLKPEDLHRIHGKIREPQKKTDKMGNEVPAENFYVDQEKAGIQPFFTPEQEQMLKLRGGAVDIEFAKAWAKGKKPKKEQPRATYNELEGKATTPEERLELLKNTEVPEQQRSDIGNLTLWHAWGRPGRQLYGEDLFPNDPKQKGKVYVNWTPEFFKLTTVYDKTTGKAEIEGYKRTYLLPKEIVDVMNHMSAESNGTMHAVNQATNMFKRLAIYSHFPSFNMFNMMGDLNLAFALHPERAKLLNEIPNAIRYLTLVAERNQEMKLGTRLLRKLVGNEKTKWTDELEKFDGFMTEKRILDAGFTSDIGRILKSSNPVKNLLVGVQRIAEYREALIRTANALYAFKEVEAGRTGDKGLGEDLARKFSFLDTKMASNPLDMAGVVSRQFMVDYQQSTSTYRRWITGFLFPFGKWTGSASKMVWKYIFSSPKRFLAGTGGLAAGPILAQLWNDQFDDIEKDLHENVRNRFHVILGRRDDGSYRVWAPQLPQDALFGTKLFGVLANKAFQYKNKEIDLETAVKDLFLDWAGAEWRSAMFLLSPLNRLIQGIAFGKDPYDNVPIYPSYKMNNMDKGDIALAWTEYATKCLIPFMNSMVSDYSYKHKPLAEAADTMIRGAFPITPGAAYDAVAHGDITKMMENVSAVWGGKYYWPSGEEATYNELGGSTQKGAAKTREKLGEYTVKETQFITELTNEWIRSGKEWEDFVDTEKYYDKFVEKMEKMYDDDWTAIQPYMKERIDNVYKNPKNYVQWLRVKIGQTKDKDERQNLMEEYKEARAKLEAESEKGYPKSVRKFGKGIVEEEISRGK